MTEENHQTESSSSSTRSSPLVQPETQTSTADPAAKSRDPKKEKCRSMTKVVIRRLPPSMSQTQFLEQTSPLPEHDYLYFVKADMSLGQYAFSRAYINFIDQRDIFIFREKFDNYVFVDAKGTEYPAVVEFAPFQRLPKKRAGKKKDAKCASIESDPFYMSFLESLQNAEGDSAVAQPKTEYSYQPVDNTLKKVTTTPLLEYLKQRKQEKQRLKDEKREERRRRDMERRRAKDEPTISKVLKNPETEKESAVREARDPLKDEKERQVPKETKARNKRDDKGREKGAGGRDRDGKPQGKQQQQQNLSRDRVGDERNNREAKHQKRNEEKRSHGKRDEKEREASKEVQGWYARKERRAETKHEENALEARERKYGEDRETTGVREERKFEGKYGRKERRNETREEIADTRERKLEEKRGKSYEKMRLEKKKLAESKRGGGGGGGDAKGNSARSSKREEREYPDKRERNVEVSQILVKTSEDATMLDNTPSGQASQRDDVANDEASRVRLELDLASEPRTKPKDAEFVDGDLSRRSKFHDADSIEDDEGDCSIRKKHGKIAQRRSSLESGAEGGGGDGGRLRRHKSLDGGEQENLRKSESHYKTKSKKDPRLERRIRNKDRPAMEIYRPGMGRFSKQRLEREKSMNDDRASLSQSPTPVGPPSSSSCSSGNPKSNGKQQQVIQQPASPSSEVRTMTFKRSASRDLP